MASTIGRRERTDFGRCTDRQQFYRGGPMRPVAFDDAETYEPEEGWRRVSMAGIDRFSFEWVEKTPGHSSPMPDHENEQVCLDGELTVETEDDAVTLQRFDSVWLDAWETPAVENTGEERAGASVDRVGSVRSEVIC